MDYSILVNKDNLIAPENLPNADQLVSVENHFDAEKMWLEKETYQQFLALREYLQKQNIFVEVCGGYRTFERAKELMEKFKEIKGEDIASKMVALPGSSEHHTGLALDYVVMQEGKPLADNEGHTIKEYDIVNGEAYKYGFIVRYPKGKENITGYMYEPWHLRYVGYDLAQYLYQHKMTLEEYYHKGDEG